MIITMTGKPCSGKTEVIKYLVKKYGFIRYSGGDIYRKIGLERGLDVLEMNRISDGRVDNMVDEEIAKIGKEKFYEDIIFDSRTAWFFIPKSFKVFLDVEEDEQARRLLTTNRESEQKYNNIEDAKSALKERWILENKRYKNLYDFDNTDLSRFDCAIDTTNNTTEEVAEKIYKEYLKFLENYKMEK